MLSKKNSTKLARLRSQQTTSIDQTIQLDQLDRKIVNLLQADGRRSFSSIARELDVSETAIRTRVGFLQKNSNLKFLAVIDPTRAGYGSWAMLGIKVESGSSPKMLGRRFAELDAAVWVGIMGGRYDLMVELWLANTEELGNFIEDHCHSCDEISSVEVMVGLNIQKWGVPVV